MRAEGLTLPKYVVDQLRQVAEAERLHIRVHPATRLHSEELTKDRLRSGGLLKKPGSAARPTRHVFVSGRVRSALLAGDDLVELEDSTGPESRLVYNRGDRRECRNGGVSA